TLPELVHESFFFNLFGFCCHETQKPFTVHLNSIDGVKRLAILDQNVGKVSGSESSATGVESCRDNNSED
ncbi:hypothetical protein L914_14725, partial [Phytophthora nicotianae]